MGGIPGGAVLDGGIEGLIEGIPVGPDGGPELYVPPLPGNGGPPTSAC